MNHAGLDDVGGKVRERSDHAPGLNRGGDDAARIDALDPESGFGGLDFTGFGGT